MPFRARLGYHSAVPITKESHGAVPACALRLRVVRPPRARVGNDRAIGTEMAGRAHVSTHCQITQRVEGHALGGRRNGNAAATKAASGTNTIRRHAAAQAIVPFEALLTVGELRVAGRVCKGSRRAPPRSLGASGAVSRHGTRSFRPCRAIPAERGHTPRGTVVTRSARPRGGGQGIGFAVLPSDAQSAVPDAHQLCAISKFAGRALLLAPRRLRRAVVAARARKVGDTAQTGAVAPRRAVCALYLAQRIRIRTRLARIAQRLLCPHAAVRPASTWSCVGAIQGEDCRRPPVWRPHRAVETSLAQAGRRSERSRVAVHPRVALPARQARVSGCRRETKGVPVLSLRARLRSVGADGAIVPHGAHGACLPIVGVRFYRTTGAIIRLTAKRGGVRESVRRTVATRGAWPALRYVAESQMLVKRPLGAPFRVRRTCRAVVSRLADRRVDGTQIRACVPR